MKLLLVLFSVGIVVGDKLPNSYIPQPSNAISAAGGGFYIQAPPPPQTQGYISPGQYFNNQGQPATVHIGYGRPSQTAGYQQTQPIQQPPIYQRPQNQYQNQYNSGSYHPTHNSGSSSVNPILKFDNVNNGDGNYRFDYLTADGVSRQEEGHIQNPGTGQQENVVRGSYSYTGPDGKVYTVTYWADHTGFHASGDHLPTPPPIPEDIQRSLDSRHQQPTHNQYQNGGYSQGYQQPYTTPSPGGYYYG